MGINVIKIQSTTTTLKKKKTKKNTDFFVRKSKMEFREISLNNIRKEFA